MTIRLLMLDVDGVLTDGRLWYGAGSEPLRAFHIQDGLAVRAFQRAGGRVAIITGKTSEAVAQRAAELGIDPVVQGCHAKGAAAQLILQQAGLTRDAAAAMGDDLQDLPMFAACGYALAPADAAAEVRAAAHFVTQRRGGQGAVREGIEHLLKLAGRWHEVVNYYAGGPAEPPR